MIQKIPFQQNVYSLYDKVAGQHGPLFEQTNDKTAIRAVHNLKLTNQSDYELLHVATWNTDSGTLMPEDPQRVVRELDPTWPTSENIDEIRSAQ